MTEERKSKSDLDNLLEDLEFLKERAEFSLAITEFGTEGRIEDAYKKLKEYITKNKEHRET